MADRLAGLLRHYSLSARVFHSGAFCGQHHYAAPHGYIHLVRRGPITARSPVHEDLLVTEPSLLFYPRVASHRFVAAPGDTAERLCAEVDLGASTGNPLAMALPSMLLIPLADLPGLGPTLELLFAEAERDQCGRQAAIDRLCELLLIQLLRYLMDGRLGATGLLAGLADPKLARAITPCTMRRRPRGRSRRWRRRRACHARASPPRSRTRWASRRATIWPTGG